jgi:hypothetical protein
MDVDVGGMMGDEERTRGGKKRRGGSERGEKNARGVRIEDLEERGVVVSTTCSDCNHNRCVPLR